MQLATRMSEMAAWCDGRLAELLPPADQHPTPLHEAMRYSCLAPGKRLRPVLVMAAAEAVGADPKSVLDAGCAVEMVHCFSLIHDDLPCIDNDDLRRGLPTCHVKFGESIALLAGDALFALAFSTLSKCAFPVEKVLRSVQLLGDATGSVGLVGGETADILAEGKASSAAEVDFIHVHKTAVLIQASVLIGAGLVGATEEQLSVFRKYGLKVGLAFQIADDILNEVSTAEDLGKAVGSDRERAKATYPAVHGLERSKEIAVALVEEANSGLRAEFPRAEMLVSLADYVVSRSK